MKTAFELAMERLTKKEPVVRLTADQKRALAELDSKYKAKIAEREIFLDGEIQKAIGQRDAEALQQLEKQLASERKVFQAELEAKKEQVRNG
jgi:molybdopterin converting factor small subunit